MIALDLNTEQKQVLESLAVTRGRGRRASEIAQATGLHVDNVVSTLTHLMRLAMAQYRVGPRQINYWYATPQGVETHRLIMGATPERN